MNFNFQQMKPVIQKDFDDILDNYPTDLSRITDLIPVGGDPYERKRIIVENAAELCPVHLFGHYPFAFEIDVGEVREVCYYGIGNECYRRSGVDFSALSALTKAVNEQNMGSAHNFTDFIHRTLDHDKLLREGFKGVYETCARLNEYEPDESKRRYRELVMTCCKAVEKIGLRLREKAREMLPGAADEDVRYNLERIIASVNTPWEPPVTMFDALNTILCTTLFISGLDGVEMNAYGALDRLIDPFYRRDLAEGRITEEEAYFLIQCFLHKTDLHCHFNEVRKTYDNGVSVMIGGCDLEGKPVFNAVTDLLLRAYTDNKLINPKLNARASASSPREYIERLAALAQTGNNNLILQNDDYIIPMFERMGLSTEDARTYVGNGCQEVICRNQIHSRAFVYLNMVKVLLDTIKYDEASLPEGLAAFYRYGSFRKDSYEALYASFMANLRSLIRTVAETFAPYEKIHHTINPEPMLSSFTDDCIAAGRDMADGGARYNHKTVSMVGFGTLCDSFLSLRRAYAKGNEKELFRAIEADFEGYDALRRSLNAETDRFGHSEEADAYAAGLAHDLAEVSRGIYNGRGIEWRTSLFTYYQFKWFGQRTGATPDGRKAGEAFSRQMNMAKMPALTSAALSMSVLTGADFNDVGMFDFSLPLTVSAGEAAKKALADYFLTCLQLKLPVLQPNVADVKTMMEERQKKGTHPDLVVRVCGYSALFSELPADTQDEIIGRLIS
ncbi:MAG: hypothetical protein IJE08_08895 [Clostridia bacterium]|nr:hypothetical protein [Clostridia bacterium]